LKFVGRVRHRAFFFAVGLSALVAPLHYALLRAGDFPEQFLRLAQRDWKDIAHDYARATGQDLTVLDLGHLTGISWLDSSFEDVARLGVYAMFAGLFWVFSRKRLPLGLMMRYFAYGIGACIVVETVFVLVGDAVFVLLSGSGSHGSMASLMAIHQIGGIPQLLYLFVVPAVIFPPILGMPRSVVVRATVLSTLTWGLGAGRGNCERRECRIRVPGGALTFRKPLDLAPIDLPPLTRLLIRRQPDVAIADPDQEAQASHRRGP